MANDASDGRRDHRRQARGFTFLLDRANIEKLRSLPDWSEKNDDTLVGEFLGGRAQQWAEALRDADAAPGEVFVEIDPHQWKAQLVPASGGALTVSL
jgi:hypothetical protein